MVANVKADAPIFHNPLSLSVLSKLPSSSSLGKKLFPLCRWFYTGLFSVTHWNIMQYVYIRPLFNSHLSSCINSHFQMMSCFSRFLEEGGVVVALQSSIFHFGILSLSIASFYLTICYVYSYFPSNCLVKTLVGAELGVPHMRLIFSWRRRLFASVDLFHLSLAASVVVVVSFLLSSRLA